MKGLLVVALVLAVAPAAWADCGCTPTVVQYGAAPAAVSTPAPTVTYSPVVQTAVPAPVVTYRPVVPAPTVVYRAPVVAAPVTVYRPVAPVTVYSPVVAAPVVAARPAVVRTKVYYPGEPIRNFFKAITP